MNLDEESRRKILYIDRQLESKTRDQGDVTMLKEVRAMVLRNNKLDAEECPIGFLSKRENPFIQKAKRENPFIKQAKAKA